MADHRTAELESLKALLDHAELTNDKLIYAAEMQRAQWAMLQQIWNAVKPREETGGESQLETLLKELVWQGQEHGLALQRIEALLAKR